MKTLIIKLGAAGDVVRTTTILNFLEGDIDWITEDMNALLLYTLPKVNRVIKKSDLLLTNYPHYDLVINLEDSLEEAEFLKNISYSELFGAYLNKYNKVVYTNNSKEWFDLSIISRFGIDKANQLKLENKKSYQELIFEGLGKEFKGEPYLLPESPHTDIYGDIAIAPKAGKVWPMKNWAYYKILADELRIEGYTVNFLPQRETLLEHLSDVRNHKYLICGDSLPMHFALGSGVLTLGIFICTSPTEIYSYNILEKVISPNLSKFFYIRDFDKSATESISVRKVKKYFKKLGKKKLKYA